MHKQNVGLHVSASGGAANAPERAKKLGAECFQFFSRSPRGGTASKITKEIEQSFKEKCHEYKMESYIHTPYYINFAALNKSIAKNTERIITEELERATQLGVSYVITHLGSAKDWSGANSDHIPNGALKQTIEGLKTVYKDSPKGGAQLLLEISAGAGAVIGNSFEDLAYIIKKLAKRNIHTCLDTAHMLATGYDIRTTDAVDKTMKEFHKHLGKERLKLVHMNDSKVDLGERKDRHEHIGKGKVGINGFKALLAHKYLQNVNFILETKHDEYIEKDLALLKKWRKIK